MLKCSYIGLDDWCTGRWSRGSNWFNQSAPLAKDGLGWLRRTTLEHTDDRRGGCCGDHDDDDVINFVVNNSKIPKFIPYTGLSNCQRIKQ